MKKISRNNIRRSLLPLAAGIFALMLESCIIAGKAPAPPPPPPPAPKHTRQGPPPWAPAHGYRARTQYIYFPAIEVYYDLDAGVYVYLERGRWVRSRSLPPSLRRHDLRKMKKEELPPGIKPQQHHQAKGKGNRGRGR